MNDFQEQAKNWLRNVVKQNPDKIKAGVEKAGDLIDKQTGGKYAEKVDAVQQKVGTFVDSQTTEQTPGQTSEQTPEQTPEQSPDGTEPSVETTSEQADGPTEARTAGTGTPAAEGSVVGGTVPDASEGPEASAGSGTEGAATGSTATGQADTGNTAADPQTGTQDGPRP
jgi:hypothetical protein